MKIKMEVYLKIWNGLFLEVTNSKNGPCFLLGNKIIFIREICLRNTFDLGMKAMP